MYTNKDRKRLIELYNNTISEWVKTGGLFLELVSVVKTPQGWGHFPNSISLIVDEGYDCSFFEMVASDFHNPGTIIALSSYIPDQGHLGTFSTNFKDNPKSKIHKFLGDRFSKVQDNLKNTANEKEFSKNLNKYMTLVYWMIRMEHGFFSKVLDTKLYDVEYTGSGKRRIYPGADQTNNLRMVRYGLDLEKMDEENMAISSALGNQFTYNLQVYTALTRYLPKIIETSEIDNKYNLYAIKGMSNLASKLPRKTINQIIDDPTYN